MDDTDASGAVTVWVREGNRERGKAIRVYWENFDRASAFWSRTVWLRLVPVGAILLTAFEFGSGRRELGLSPSLVLDVISAMGAAFLLWGGVSDTGLGVVAVMSDSEREWKRRWFGRPMRNISVANGRVQAGETGSGWSMDSPVEKVVVSGSDVVFVWSSRPAYTVPMRSFGQAAELERFLEQATAVPRACAPEHPNALFSEVSAEAEHLEAAAYCFTEFVTESEHAELIYELSHTRSMTSRAVIRIGGALSVLLAASLMTEWREEPALVPAAMAALLFGLWLSSYLWRERRSIVRSARTSFRERNAGETIRQGVLAFTEHGIAEFTRARRAYVPWAKCTRLEKRDSGFYLGTQGEALGVKRQSFATATGFMQCWMVVAARIPAR
jgi:hypothetical protein